MQFRFSSFGRTVIATVHRPRRFATAEADDIEALRSQRRHPAVVHRPHAHGTISLRIPALDLTRELDLTPGADFPGADTTLGAQIRLHQLGFYFGQLNGDRNVVLDDAVAVFKASQGLPSRRRHGGRVGRSLRQLSMILEHPQEQP